MRTMNYYSLILLGLVTLSTACMSGSAGNNNMPNANVMIAGTPGSNLGRPNRPSYGRVSFDMMNTPDEIYNTYQPLINFYNITINETMSLPFQLFAVKFYNYPTNRPNAVAERLITLIDSVDEYSLKTFCHYLPSQLLRNMIDIPSDLILKPQQQLVNLEFFSRCAVHFGDAPSLHHHNHGLMAQIGLFMMAMLTFYL